MLPGHEAHILYLEFPDDAAELDHSPAPLGGVVGGVREVAREHDEVGLDFQRVDARHRRLQRGVGLRIGGPAIAPIGIGQLHEKEFLVACGAVLRAGACRSMQCGYEYGAAAHGGKPQKASAIDHRASPGNKDAAGPAGASAGLRPVLQECSTGQACAKFRTDEEIIRE